MKRFIVMILPALILALSACGGDSEPAATAVPPTPPVEETPTEEGSLPPPAVVTGEGDEEPTPQIIETEIPPSGPVEPWPADAFGYGVQSHAVVGDPKVAMDVISNQLGMDWVKVQMEWPLVQPDLETYQWFFYDGVVDEAKNHGLHLLFSVVGAPAWTRQAGNENGPPDDFSRYSDFLAQLMNRYPGQIDAIEVWNEQNLDREWESAEGLSPSSYVQFLAQAQETIKSIDPNIIVVSGALAPTGIHDQVTSYDDFIYMDEMLAAGMLKYADCVGAHHNGYNIGPDVPFDQTNSDPNAATAGFRGPFENPHHSWSFKTTLDTYAEKIQAVDPEKKLCVTEFGWASSEGYDTYPTGFEFAQDNTLEEQAQFIVQAFEQMRESGDVWLAFLFNFDFGNKSGGPTDDPVVYSIVDTNGIPRPAFGAVAEMPKP